MSYISLVAPVLLSEPANVEWLTKKLFRHVYGQEPGQNPGDIIEKEHNRFALKNDWFITIMDNRTFRLQYRYDSDVQARAAWIAQFLESTDNFAITNGSRRDLESG